MQRRVRRPGVRFIEDDRDCSLTFFKRHTGLFKAVADLSTLTDAKIFIVLESGNGRIFSFGTPTVGPIVDAFLSGNALVDSYASEEQKATITNLQNELFQLEKDKVIEDKRKEFIAQAKEIQESSRMVKYVYGKEEDLGVNELYEMYHELSDVNIEINNRLLALHCGNHQQIGGQRDLSLLQPSWRHSLSSQISLPPRYFPCTHSQPSLHLPWPSWLHPMPTRSKYLLLDPMMRPSPQQPPKSLSLQPMASLTPSMVRLQAQRMPLPKEAHPYNYRIQEMGSNNSHAFLQSHILPSPPPQPSPLQIPPSNELPPPLLSSPHFSLSQYPKIQLRFKAQNYNSMEPPLNYANAGSTLIPSNEPHYGNFCGLNVDLENASGNGGQIGSDNNMLGFSGLLQGDGCAEMMFELPSAGESSCADA